MYSSLLVTKSPLSSRDSALDPGRVADKATSDTANADHTVAFLVTSTKRSVIFKINPVGIQTKWILASESQRS